MMATAAETEKESPDEPDVYDLGEDKIGFYCDISCKTVSLLVKMLMNKADLLTALHTNEKRPRPDLFVYVRSGGGSICSALAAYDHIRHMSKRVRVITIAEGHIASCATLLFLAGERRMATRHSTFLFHQLSTTFHGTYTNLRYELKECASLMRMMSRILFKYSNLSKRDVAKLLKKELVLTSKECKRMGLFCKYY